MTYSALDKRRSKPDKPNRAHISNTERPFGPHVNPYPLIRALLLALVEYFALNSNGFNVEGRDG